MLYEVHENMWEEETFPEDWKEGHLVKIPNKGALPYCLFQVKSSTGSSSAALETVKRDQQIGFRANRSCTDHIVTLRIIVEQSLAWNLPLYATFVDLEKAFDNVNHATLWKILHYYGIPEKFIPSSRRRTAILGSE